MKELCVEYWRNPYQPWKARWISRRRSWLQSTLQLSNIDKDIATSGGIKQLLSRWTKNKWYQIRGYRTLKLSLKLLRFKISYFFDKSCEFKILGHKNKLNCMLTVVTFKFLALSWETNVMPGYDFISPTSFFISYLLLSSKCKFI